MAEGPEINRFETTDLASFYKKNGSQFSAIQPRAGQFDFSGPEVDSSVNQTPLDSFIEALQNPADLAATQEKSGIEVFPMPSTPPKVGIQPEGFTFSPVFTTPEVSNNIVTPAKTGPEIQSFGATPKKSAPEVSNKMASPAKTAPEVSNNIVTPTKTGPQISAFGATPEKTAPQISQFEATPEKSTPEIAPFEATPEKSTPEISQFAATPEKTAPEIAPFEATPEKTAPEVANNMASPEKTAPQVSAFGFVPGFTTPDLKIVNGSPDIDATGFTKEMKSTQFKGISGTSPLLKFASAKPSTVLKVRNGLSDIDMNGFITGKKHLDASDFKGISGQTPNLQFKMSTTNPGNSSTWTREQYNEQIGFGLNTIPNIAQNGFTTGKIHKSTSDFIGIDGEKYTYPTLEGLATSYRFGTQNYDTVFAKVTPSSAPGKTDSVGQQFKIAGGTSPYGDFNIQARKSQYFDSSFESKISKQYLEIPGKGETDLRKESRNDFSFGNATDQPFIVRDIGSNWSLFSSGPGPKFGIDLIRGGVGTAINRSLVDFLRLGKFLISPKGLLFIAKNVGMQLTNPKMQIDNIIGIGANRVYALGLPTIAQSLTNAIGIHLVRHGLGPLNSTLPKNARYEDNIFNMENRAAQAASGGAAKKALSEAGFDSPDTSELTNQTDVNLDPASGTPTPLGKGNPRTKSRLAFLQTDLKSGLLAVADADGKGAGKADILTGAIAQGVASLTGGMSKASIARLSDKGFFGPNSVYGIGGTTIFRSRVGIGVSAHEETGGTYGDSRFLKGYQNSIDPLDKTAINSPSVARQYDTPDPDNKYSDKNGTNTFDDMTAEGPGQSQLASRLNAIIETEGEDAAPDDSSHVTSDGHTPFPTVEEGNLYYSQNQRLRRYETLAYGQIPKNADRIGHNLMDFREMLLNDNKNFQQPNGGDTEGLPWGGQDMVTRFGADYGKITTADGAATADRSNRLFDLGYDDKVVNNEGRTLQQANTEAAEYSDTFEDLIKFRFSSKRPGVAEESLQFRAYLSGISDSFNFSWQDISYVGRTTPTYLFQSIERAASFEFKLYSMTRAELEANYKRLNRFVQFISPEFKSGLPVGPLIKLTIGDWWVENPFIVDSFSMTPVDNAPWDIDEGRQLPFYVDCSVSGKILFSKAVVGGEVTDRVHSSATDAFAAISNNTWRVTQ